MRNNWVDRIKDWGQQAIDEEPVLFDRREGREDLFDAVIQSLVPKENAFGIEPVDYSILANPKLVLLPLSGGLDSFIAYERARDLGHEIRAFYVRLATPYAKLEMKVCKELGIEHEILNFSEWPKRWEPYKTRWQHILPLRNLLIIMAIAEQEGSRPGEIWLGATEGEIPLSGGDKSEQFFAATDALLNTYPVKHDLKFPLRTETKADLIAWWIQSGRDPAWLKQTVTCQAGTSVACGACHACFNRWVAFTVNDMSEKMLTNPKSITANRKKIEAFQKALWDGDFSVWSKRRIDQTLAAWYKDEVTLPPSVNDMLKTMGAL